MKSHLHTQPLPLIEESPQTSHRSADILGLIEKKLSTIESSFQKLDDRISRIETRDPRSNGASNIDKIERGMKEHQLAIDNLYDRVKHLNQGPKPQQNKFSEEVIDIVKKYFGGELQALTKLVRTIQESQAHLQSEFNAFKKSQPDSQDTDRYNGRLSHTRAHNQSPLRVKFEREPADSEDERYPVRRTHQEDNYPQASPYSPPKNKFYYQESRVHTEGDYHREETRSNSYNRSTNSRSSHKKYEPLRTEPESREDDTRASAFFKEVVSNGSSSAQKNKQRLSEESPQKDWRTSNARGSKKTTFFDLEEPKESKAISLFPKTDKGRDAFGTQEAAILQSKQKIREDIDNLKRLVIRENEERSVSREKLKSTGDKASQSGDERKVIRLQSTMPKPEEPAQPFEWVADEVERDTHNSSRQNSHRDYNIPVSRNDNLRRELPDQDRNISSSSKTRSTSLYDAKPLVQGSKPERKDNQLTPEQKKQIDMEIQRKIKEETERRKRQSTAKKSSVQTVEYSRTEYTESGDEIIPPRSYTRTRAPLQFEDQKPYQFAK